MKSIKFSVALFIILFSFLFQAVGVWGATSSKNITLNEAQAEESAKDTVGARELTIIVSEGQSKIYGETDPEFEFIVEGFEDGDDDSILTGSLSREQGEEAGVYLITQGSLHAENYNISLEGAVFEIKTKELIVQAREDQSKVYRDIDPPLRFTAEGFVNGDDSSILTGNVIREEGEDAGVYAINQGTLDAGKNYHITFSGTAFEILPRALTLTNFTAESRTYDGTTDVSGTGFDDNRLSGDEIEFEYNAFFIGPDVARDQTVEYTDIRLSGGAQMHNYTLETTAGTAKADIYSHAIKIAAEPVNIEYGELDPWLEWTIAEGQLMDDDEITGELSRVKGMDAGNYVINQGTLTAGPNYKITFVPAIFKISPRELSVVADSNQTKVYGSRDPELTYIATGFAPGDDSNILSGELEREEGENAGEYKISRGTLRAGRNYAVSFKAATFEIIPIELIVQANEGQSKIYGGDDPAFDYTAKGFVNGEDYNVFRGRLSRRTGENVGTYRILAGDLTAGDNYSIAFQGADFEITPRELIVSADAGQRKVYGERDPQLTFTASNFGKNDDDRIFSGSLARVDGESAGYYEIYQNDLDAGKNYTINFNEERFEITYRTLEVKVEAGQYKVYGRNDPRFSYSVEGFAFNDNRSVLRGALSRPEGEDAGEYPITIGSLSASGNYKINFTSDVFEIIPKRLNVSAERGQYKFKGEEDPEFTFSARGFEFDDDSELIRGSLSREPGDDTGSYRIKRGSLDAGRNYTISFSDNVFHVLMTPPAVTEFTPAEDEENAPVDTPIEIELDQPIFAADKGLITVEDAHQQFLPVQAQIDGNTLRIKHEGLEYETDYVINIPFGSVRNEDWIVNDDIQYTFKTRILIPPQPVVLETPHNEEGTVSRNPELKWGDAKLAEEYRIQVSSDRNFDQLLLDRNGITDQSIAFGSQLDYYSQYFWRVKASNSAGDSEWSDVHSFTTVAELPELLFPAMHATGISIAPTFEWTSSYENEPSRLQLSKDENFTEIEIDTVIHDLSVQLTGLDDNIDYFWRVRVEREQGNSEWTVAEQFQTRADPADLDGEMVLDGVIDFGGPASGGDLSNMDYRLIGLPGKDQHRVDELFNGTYGTDWKAFLGGGSEKDQYEEYKPGDERFTFEPGRGFWVLSKHSVDLDLRISSVPTNSRDSYSIELQPGWNIISNPHRTVVSWADVKEINNISGDLYGYRSYFSAVDSLRPVEGYYYYNEKEEPISRLEIPYSSLQNRRSGPGNGASALANISQSNLKTAQVFADFGEEVTFGVEIVFPGDEEKEKNRRFNKHFPSLDMSRKGMILADSSTGRGGLLKIESEYDERGVKHELELKGVVGTPFRWSADLTGLGSSARVLLVNPETNQSWLLANDEEITATVSEAHTIYELYIGDEHYLMEKQQSILPAEIALEQNYPNPFNPTTNIRYSLPEQQHVRLEVYDVMGRRVQVIQDGLQQAGWHIVQFDGSNLASGVYFYRLNTDDVVKTGRMTLVK